MVEVPLTWQLAKLGLPSAWFGLKRYRCPCCSRIAGLLRLSFRHRTSAVFYRFRDSTRLRYPERRAYASRVYRDNGIGAGYVVTGRQPGIKGVNSGVLGGYASWLFMSTLLAQFSFTRFSGTLVTLCAIGVFSWLFRSIPDVKSTASSVFSWPALAARAGLATVIIFAITRIAHWLPPEWAGTLAAFPVTMLPFLLILHVGHGYAPVATVIKHYPILRLAAELRPMRFVHTARWGFSGERWQGFSPRPYGCLAGCSSLLGNSAVTLDQALAWVNSGRVLTSLVPSNNKDSAMFTRTIEPAFYDTDALGHINNTRLPAWFELARNDLFKLFTPDLNPKQWRLIMARMEVDYRAERFTADIEIRTI